MTWADEIEKELLSRLSGERWVRVSDKTPVMDGQKYQIWSEGYPEESGRNGYDWNTAQNQSVWYSFAKHGFGITYYRPLPAPPSEPSRESDHPCDDPSHCHNGVCRMTASCQNPHLRTSYPEGGNQPREGEDQFRDDDEESICPRCGGEGFILICPDDICQGQGECMHGDGEIVCPNCEGSGEGV